MRILLAFVLVSTVGCAGDEVDEGNGLVCTGLLYQNCNSEHDCESNDCHTFAPEGYNACVQACSATVPCPDLNGVAVTCDIDGGYCKPPMQIACRVL